MHLAGKWEFPGGKIEEGETAEACIVREIKEGLDIVIRPIEHLIPVDHYYPEKSIRLIPFKCEIVEGEFSLAEHDKFLWVGKDDLLSLDWADADRAIIEMYGLG
jgi:8-oxo-dGTP diphosphatase